MLLFLFVIFCTYAVVLGDASNADDTKFGNQKYNKPSSVSPVRAFIISGASIANVNAVYVCLTPDSCTSITTGYRYAHGSGDAGAGTGADTRGFDTGQYNLDVAHVMTSSSASPQRRWYLSGSIGCIETDTGTGKDTCIDTNTSRRQLYGAVELQQQGNTTPTTSSSSSSLLLLSPWKRIGGNANGSNKVEHAMHMRSMSLQCRLPTSNITSSSRTSSDSDSHSDGDTLSSLSRSLFAAIAIQEMSISGKYGHGQEQVQELARHCIGVVLNVMTTTTRHTPTTATANATDTDKDTDREFLYRIHQLLQVIQSHATATVANSSLSSSFSSTTSSSSSSALPLALPFTSILPLMVPVCQWAVMIPGGWETTGRSCYHTMLRVSTSMNMSILSQSQSLSFSICIYELSLRSAIYSLSLDLDTSSILFAYSSSRSVSMTILEREGGMDIEKDKDRESLWTAFNDISHALSRSQLPSLSSSLSPQSLSTLHPLRKHHQYQYQYEYMSSLSRVCAVLKSTAKWYGIATATGTATGTGSSLGDVLNQVCEYVRVKKEEQATNTVTDIATDTATATGVEFLDIDASHSLIISLIGVGSVSLAGSHACHAVLGQLVQGAQAHKSYVDAWTQVQTKEQTNVDVDVLFEQATLTALCDEGSSSSSSSSSSIGDLPQESQEAQQKSKWCSRLHLTRPYLRRAAHTIIQHAQLCSTAIPLTPSSLSFPSHIANFNLHRSVNLEEAVRMHTLLRSLSTGSYSQTQSQTQTQQQQQLQKEPSLLLAVPVWSYAANHGNILALLVTSILQLCTPQVLNLADMYGHEYRHISSSNSSSSSSSGSLSSSVSLYEAEVSLLRLIAEDSLLILTRTMCSRSHNSTGTSSSSSSYGCTVTDPVSSIGVRGLFLLAYQGLEASALWGSLMTRGRGRAGKIPWLYRQFMMQTQPHWPWQWQAQGQGVPTTTATVTSRNSSNSRIRVGFVSSFFFQHSVGRLLAEVIIGLSTWNDNSNGNNNSGEGGGASSSSRSSLLDIYVIDIRPRPHSSSNSSSDENDDSITKALRQAVCSTCWHDHTTALSSNDNTNANTATAAGLLPLKIGSTPTTIVNYLRALNLNIAIFGDNFMDSTTTHVLMMRVSPLQILFWGHPYTSGFPTVDYFITSGLFESKIEEAESEYEDTESEYAETEDEGNDGRIGGQIHVKTTSKRQAHYSEQLVQFDSLTMLMFAKQRSISSSSSISKDQYSEQKRDARDEDGGRSEEKEEVKEELQGAMHLDGTPFDNIEQFLGREAGTATAAPDTATHTYKHIYSCLQSQMKMHSSFDRVIIELLMRDEHAVLALLYNARQPLWHRMWVERLRYGLKNAATVVVLLNMSHSQSNTTAGTGTGTGAADIKIMTMIKNMENRLIFFRQTSHTYYTRLLCTYSAVVLDTFPFGGGVTMTDALSCRHNSGSGNGSAISRQQQQQRYPVVLTSGALQTVHRLAQGFNHQLGEAYSSVSAGSSHQHQHQQACCHRINSNHTDTGIGIRIGSYISFDCTADTAGRLLAMSVNVIGKINVTATPQDHMYKHIHLHRHYVIDQFVTAAVCLAQAQAQSQVSESDNINDDASDDDDDDGILQRLLFGSSQARSNSDLTLTHKVIKEWNDFLHRI